MGFACTLLGHRYGDVEVEQDREERGGEVITVTREVATCERCGHTRVLSENTEVTSVVDADDVDADVDTDTGTEPVAPDDTQADAGGDTGGDVERRAGADDDTDERAAGVDTDAGTDEQPGPTGAEEGTGVVDLPENDADADADTGAGAEVLDGDDTDTHADVGAGAGGTPASDPGADVPEPPEEDAEILEDDDAERDYGEWPESGRDDEERAAERAAAGDEAEGNGADAEKEEDEAAGRGFEEIDPAADVPETLSCPDCGFRTPAAGAALRAGDACPDCGDAYLRAEGRERNP